MIRVSFIYIYTISWSCAWLRQNLCMNRPAVIRTYMDIWIGLDHLRFGMDRGMDRPMNFRVWIGLSIVTRYIQLTLPAAFNDVLRQENAMVQTGETGDQCHSDPK